MLMHNRPHPGEVIRELCLAPLELSVTDAAKALGVSRKTLSAILNGRAGVSPEMAVRLSIAFDTTAESWLNQQLQYDLWNAEQYRKGLRVKRLVAARIPPDAPNRLWALLMVVTPEAGNRQPPGGSSIGCIETSGITGCSSSAAIAVDEPPV